MSHPSTLSRNHPLTRTLYREGRGDMMEGALWI